MASTKLKIAVLSLVFAGFITALVRQQREHQRLQSVHARLVAEMSSANAAPSTASIPVAPPAAGPTEELLRLRGEVAQLRAQQGELAWLKAENERLRAAPVADAPRPKASTEEDFLAANALAEGVHQTDSGLQYKIVSSGTGRTPKPTDTVEVHYHGKLVDGTVFDSSLERGQSMKFPVGAVVPGWSEALQLMKEGDKWELFVPSKLAYGDKGVGDKIAPKSTLIFEVELLSIESKEP